MPPLGLEIACIKFNKCSIKLLKLACAWPFCERYSRTIATISRRKAYRPYTNEPKVEFLQLLTEMVAVKKATDTAGI